jgi:hypothetical protein
MEVKVCIGLLEKEIKKSVGSKLEDERFWTKQE